MKCKNWALLFLVNLIIVAPLLAQNENFSETRTITLSEAIDLTMLNNLELRMAKKDSAIAVENILDAKNDRLPFVQMGLFYNYIGNPVLYRGFYSNDSVIDYYHHQAGWNVAAGFPIYMGGKIKTRIAQEEVASSIQNEFLKMTASQQKLAIINQFYNLHQLYKEVEIIKANISNIKIRIQQLQSRVKNGQNLISDLTRTELQLSNYEINVFSKQNNIILLSNYICSFTGLSQSTLLEPRDVVVEIPPDTFVYANCLEVALTNRNEITQSQLQKNYSELSLKMTKNALKPVISGTAIYNSELPVPGTFPPQSDILNYWAAGVGVTYEISSLYNLNHKVRRGTLQIERDNLNIENVRNSIDQELKVAFILFLESKKNVETYQKNVELADLNYKIVKSKYDNEFALIIDMIDAEAQVNDAKLSLNNAIVDAISQYYNLLYAMGKLN